MGKAAAIILLVVIFITAGMFLGRMMVAVVQNHRWRRALQQARWEPFTKMISSNEVSITVRRVARLRRRYEVLHEFTPEIIEITGIGDPKLVEVQAMAAEQAEINNAISLGNN
jgi:hypothetical protein